MADANLSAAASIAPAFQLSSCNVVGWRGRDMRQRSFWTGVLALIAVPGIGWAADVTAGDVVTAANVDNVRALVPEELAPFTIDNFPDLEMKIVATEDYTPQQKYVDATVKYACQASIGAKGELVNYT